MTIDIQYIDGPSGRTAILPGEHVSSFVITLPDLPPNRLERVLPGVMADRIATDIDTTNVSLINPLGGGRWLVTACSHEVMASLSGISVEAIWPDYLSLPLPDQGLAIYKEGSRLLARRPDGTGFSMSSELTSELVGDDAIGVNPSEFPVGPGMATGSYSPAAPLSDWLALARRPAIIGGVVLTIWCFLTIFEIRQLEENRDALIVQGEEVFKQAQPDVTRIVNAEVQLRAMVQEARQSGGTDFTDHFARLVSVISKIPGVRVEEIDWQQASAGRPDERLLLTVSTGDFASLDQLAADMEIAGYSTDQGESNRQGDRVYATIQLEEAIP